MDPFIGEIRLMGFPFPPKGWQFCQGQLLPINQNQALFSLLGTTYGGNGTTTFGLPDLRGRVVLGVGSGPGLSPYIWGQQGGTEAVALTPAQMPPHGHTFTGTIQAAGEAEFRARPTRLRGLKRSTHKERLTRRWAAAAYPTRWLLLAAASRTRTASQR
jgi:microcystin-dependent protein